MLLTELIKMIIMIVIIIMIRKKGEKEPKIISSKPSTKIAERQKLYQKSN